MEILAETIENWNAKKEKMKLRFGILKDRDLLLLDGKYDEMLGKLNLILGRSKEELHKIISEI